MTNIKRTYRLYTALGLQLRNKLPKRRASSRSGAARSTMPRLPKPNERQTTPAGRTSSTAGPNTPGEPMRLNSWVEKLEEQALGPEQERITEAH